jgi:lysophospholipase L1-like esterase
MAVSNNSSSANCWYVDGQPITVDAHVDAAAVGSGGVTPSTEQQDGWSGLELASWVALLALLVLVSFAAITLALVEESLRPSITTLDINIGQPVAARSPPLLLRLPHGQDTAPINLHRLVRFLDRLHRGLPVLVASIGGSNIRGDGLTDHKQRQNGTVDRLFVEWLNQRFPVDPNATDPDAAAPSVFAAAAARMQPADVQLCTRLLELKAPLQHQALNRAVGATKSDMASFCLDRLLPCVSLRSPDVVLVDYAMNDAMGGQDLTSFDPSTNMERLVRNVLSSLPNAAVILLYFPASHRQQLHNAEAAYADLAARYHVLEISVKQWEEDFLLQPDQLTGPPAAPRTASAHRPRLMPYRLPLPLSEILHSQAPQTDWERALHNDGNHLSEFGHQLMLTLLNQQLLRLYHNLQISNWTAIADPWMEADATAAQQNHPLLQRTLAALPAPLSPALQSAALNGYHCLMLYYPYNERAMDISQAEAEAFLSVQRNSGFQYGQIKVGWKYALQVLEHNRTTGQRLIIRTEAAIHMLTVGYLRSWDGSKMGAAHIWLSCDDAMANASWPLTSAASRRSTAALLLNGTWTDPSTQVQLTQVWPLTDAALADVATAAGSSPECELRYIHLEHTVPGEFSLIGYVWN